MIGAYLLKVLTLFAMCLLKITFVPFIGFSFGFSWIESFIYAIIGGLISLTIFTQFDAYIMKAWQYFFPPKKGKKIANARKYLRFWRKYGLYGVMFLSPLIIMIPLGGFLALRFGTTLKKIYFLMFLSLTFWSGVLTAIAYLGVDSILNFF